ncbi:MAG: glycosyltransferase [Candidatus Brennerbacteria bacterium]
MTHIPSISVILAVYNGARFVRDSITSVLAQTFRDFELIIVNDGSTDGTADILDGFRDERIVRLTNEKNIGLVRSLNRGLEVARGTYIARADADDWSDTSRFEKQIKYLESHPEIGVVGTHVAQVDARGRGLSVLRPPETHAAIFWELIFGLPLVHPSVMMRRNVVAAAEGYDPAFIHIEDTELWSRLIAKTRFANIPEVLCTKRVHSASIGSTQSDIQYQSGIIIRKRIFKEILRREVSDVVVGWVMQPERVLTVAEAEEATKLLKELLTYFLHLPGITSEAQEFFRNEAEKRLSLARTADCRKLRKWLKTWLRRVLPSSFRHKLRTSFLGRYFERSL